VLLTPALLPFTAHIRVLRRRPTFSAMFGQQKASFASGVPRKRLGPPEEIAEAILFVASEKAAFISGASIPFNGGKAAL
jgi:NAD(P)-dependent dehydrogenase (short-subunit alcohol dehydrogenase family)